MQEIKLTAKSWLINEAVPLGERGGFGAVFFGQDAQGGEVAIKRLHIGAADAAHRELSFAQHLSGRTFAHVIPTYDSGLDPDSGCYFVVMARAQHSLEAVIRKEGWLQEASTAAHVLLEIAQGLSEVPEIVHRDLKPANVLWHDGHWKVADFGIARFVEDATSLRTLRECLTPNYAAPEQWRSERASAATDLYALGCIGYALLTGNPPFRGSSEDLRRQHLEVSPAALAGVHPRLHSILSMLLRKAPEARPSRERTVKLLEEFIEDFGTAAPPAGSSPLAEAGAVEAARQAAEDAKAASRRAEVERRERLAREASMSLNTISEQLLSTIEREAPSATMERPGRGANGWRATLGSAQLEIVKLATDWHYWYESLGQSRWDFIMGATVKVVQSRPDSYVWGASLWYARRNAESYRWWEVGYMDSPLRGMRAFQPFALDSIGDAVEAMGPGMGAIQEAYTPLPVDDEHANDFVQRWIGLLVKAYKGELEHPRSLPLIWDRP